MCHLCEARKVLEVLKVAAAASGDPVQEASVLVMECHLNAKSEVLEALDLCNTVIEHQASHPLFEQFKSAREHLIRIDGHISDMASEMARITREGVFQQTAPSSDRIN